MEDVAYIMYQSLMTLLIWVNTKHTHIILRGTGYFLVTARLLLLFCYYYGIYVCNYCYKNLLQFPTQLVSPCISTTQNGSSNGFKQGY